MPILNTTAANESIFRKAVEDELGGKVAKVFVDIGSGDGKYSRELGEMMSAERVICLDHDVQALKKAEARDCEAVACDLNVPIPLSDGSTDLILANQLIEHMAKTDLLVKEMHRVLRKGGEAVLCTPNLSSWHNVAALMMGWQPFSMQISDDYYLGNPWHPNYKRRIEAVQAHLRVFTHKSLGELLLAHGFDEVSTKGVGYYPFAGGLAINLARLDWRHSAYILVTARKLR